MLTFQAFALLLLLGFGPLQDLASMTPEDRARAEAQNRSLLVLVGAAPALPFEATPIGVREPSADGWGLGMVSWVASDDRGLVYLLNRGDKADPVVVVDSSGNVVRSWGRGLYTTPHAIRVDVDGNVWTTDSGSSMVYKFSPDGETLLRIEVGGIPADCGNFCGTTDVAFAPNGHVFVADGYRNARILEYSPEGRKLKEWGSAGTGPGQFRLPHSIQIDDNGVVYVADRENGRVQRFDMDGAYLGEWSTFGKTFGLELAGNALWLSSVPRGPNNAPGWLLKVDPATGKLLGYVESLGNHGVDVMENGDLLHSPGPDLAPQLYRRQP